MTDLTISDVRKKFPQYSDMSDKELADALHTKFYSDMPVEDFYGKIGFSEAPRPAKGPSGAPQPAPGYNPRLALPTGGKGPAGGPEPASTAWQAEDNAAYWKQRGQQAARGYGNAIAGVPEGIGFVGAVLDQALEERLRENPDERAKWVEMKRQEIADLTAGLETFDEEDRPLWRQKIADAERSIARIEGRIGPVKASDTNGVKRGAEIKKFVSDTVGVPDPRDQSMAGQIAEGLGNVAGFLTTSAIPSKYLSLLAGAEMGAGMNASQVYEEAIKSGADEATAVDAAKWALAIGASEIIPINRALGVLPPTLRPKITGPVLKRFADIAQSSGEEAAQEFLSQVANNILASQYYDPDRGWTEGAGEAAILGSILGAGLSGAVNVSGAAIEVGSADRPADEAAALTQEAIPTGAPRLQGPAGAPAAPTTAPAPASEVAPDQKAALDAKAAPPAETIEQITKRVMSAPAKPAPAAPVTAPGNAAVPQPAQPAPQPASQPSPASPESAGDTAPTIPEAPATIASQNDALLDPKNPRRAVYIPFGTQAEAPFGSGIKMLSLEGGVLYLNTKKGIGPKTAMQLYKTGRLGEVLGLGEITKAQAVQSAAKGNKPVAVTERQPDGLEVKAAAGTTETAPDQVAALEAEKTPGNTVQVEEPEQVAAERQAAQPSPAAQAMAELDAAKEAPTEQVAEPTEQVAPAQPSPAAQALADLEAANPVRQRPDLIAEYQAKYGTPAAPKVEAPKDEAAPVAQPEPVAPKAAPKAAAVKEVAKKRETAKAPKAEPVTSQGSGPSTDVRIEVDPKKIPSWAKRDGWTIEVGEDGKAYATISQAKVAENNAKFNDEVKSRLNEENKSEAAENRADSRAAARSAIDERIRSGELKDAVEETNALIEAGGKKMSEAEKEKLRKDARIAGDLMESDAPSEFIAVEDIEGKKALLERLNSIIDKATKAGFGWGRKGVTAYNARAVTWLYDVRTHQRKLAASLGKVTYKELNAFLADEVATKKGDARNMKDRRKEVGEQNSKPSGASDAADVAVSDTDEVPGEAVDVGSVDIVDESSERSDDSDDESVSSAPLPKEPEKTFAVGDKVTWKVGGESIPATVLTAGKERGGVTFYRINTPEGATEAKAADLEPRESEPAAKAEPAEPAAKVEPEDKPAPKAAVEVKKVRVIKKPEPPKAAAAKEVSKAKAEPEPEPEDFSRGQAGDQFMSAYRNSRDNMAANEKLADWVRLADWLAGLTKEQWSDLKNVFTREMNPFTAAMANPDLNGDKLIAQLKAYLAAKPEPKVLRKQREESSVALTQEEWGAVTDTADVGPAAELRATIETVGISLLDLDAEVRKTILEDLGVTDPEALLAEETSTVQRVVDQHMALSSDENSDYDPIAAEVAQQLVDSTDNIEVLILSDENFDLMTDTAAGYYTRGRDRIVMRRSSLEGPNGMAIVTHEMAHAALSHALDANKAARKQILALRSIVAKYALANHPDTYFYGLHAGTDEDTMVHEFIAEAVSDLRFRKLLTEVKLGLGDQIKLRAYGLKVTERGKVETAFDWLKQFAAKVYTKIKGVNSYDAALQIVEVLLDQSRLARGNAGAFGTTLYSKAGSGGVTKKGAKRSLKPTVPGEAANTGRSVKSKMTPDELASIAQEYSSAPKDSAPVTPTGSTPNASVPPGADNATKLKAHGLNARQVKEVAAALNQHFGGKATDEQLKTIADEILKQNNPAEAAAKPAKKQAAKVIAAGKRLNDEAAKIADEDFVPGKNPGRPWVLQALTNSQIARVAERWFGAENNPVTKLAKIVEKRRVTKARYLRDMSKAVQSISDAMGRHSKAQIEEFFSLVHDVTMAGVHPDVPVDHGRNNHLGKDALRGMWAKGQHPELARRFQALPQDLKEVYAEVRDTLTDAQNRMTYGLMRNILNAAGHTDEAMIKRFHEDKATEADYKAVGEELAHHLEKATDLKRIRGPYFNLARRGDYVVHGTYKLTPPGNATVIEPNVFEFATRKEAIAYVQKQDLKSDIQSVWIDKKTGKRYFEDEGGQVKVSPNDTDSKNVFRVTVQDRHVEFVDSMGEAKRLTKELEAKGLKMKDPEDKAWQRHAQNAEMLSDQYRSLLATLDKRDTGKNLTPEQRASVKAILNEVSLRFLGSTRIQSSRLPRRHVEGASVDLLRNTYDYVTETAGYLARLDTEPTVEAAMVELEERTKALSEQGKGYGTGARAISNEISKRVLDPQFAESEGAVAGAVKRLTTLSFVDNLASSAYSMINAVSGMMMANVHLAGEFNPVASSYNIIKAMKDIGVVGVTFAGIKDTVKALGNVTATGENYISDVMARLEEPRERQMLQSLADEGLIDAEGGLEVARMVEAPEGIARVFDVPMDYAQNIVRAMPQAVEAMNRTVTALAAYRMAYARTKDHAKAVKFAADSVDMTQGNYSGTNAPPVFNSKLGRIVLQFKKYSQMIAYFMGRNIRRAVMGGAKGDRRKGIMTMAYLLAGQQIMAGTLGLPLEPVKLVMLAASSLGLTDDEYDDFQKAVEEFYKRLTGSDKAAEALTYGVTRALPGGMGFDLNSRMGMDSMATFGEPRSSDSQDEKAWLFNLVTGAPGATLYDMKTGVQDLVKGNIAKGLEKAIPFKVFSDAAKAYRGENMTTQEIVLKTIGLNPARVAREGLESRRSADGKQEARSKEYELRDAYMAARTSAELTKLKGRIRDFNATLPKDSPYRISLDALEKRRQAEFTQ